MAEKDKKELDRIFSQKFETVDDIISDALFRKHLTKFMQDLIDKRTTREAPPEGKKWVRDWLDTLIDKGVGADGYFIDEIERVLLKTSTMSSNVRNNLSMIVRHCIGKACDEYLESEKVQV